MSEIKSLSIWMTREEFLTVWAFQWTAHVYPAYGADQMTEPERQAIFADSLGNALRWGIRELIERGFRFTALALDTRGEIVLTQPEAVEPNNILLVGKIARGKMLSPVNAIEVALAEFDKQGVVIERGPMVEILDQTRRDVAVMRAQFLELMEEHPEIKREADKIMRDAAASVGCVPVPVYRKEQLN